jgi:hypothetical protein
MNRKLIIFGIIGLAVIWAGYKALTNNDSPQPQPDPPKTSKPAAWNGTRVKDYNLLRSVDSSSFNISRVAFSGLKGKKSRVVVDMSVSGSPAWFNKKSFYGFQSNNPGKVYKPKMLLGKNAGNTTGRLVFNGVPAKALGAVCGQNYPKDSFSLIEAGLPGKTVALKLNAPSAPPGHCLQSGKPKPKPNVKISRVKVTKKKVVVFGRTENLKVKRVRVQVRGKVKSTARPIVRQKKFSATFKLPKGKYQARAGLKKWYSNSMFRVRKNQR